MTTEELVGHIIVLIESHKPYIDEQYGTVINSLHLEYANLLDQIVEEVKQLYQLYKELEDPNDKV